MSGDWITLVTLVTPGTLVTLVTSFKLQTNLIRKSFENRPTMTIIA